MIISNGTILALGGAAIALGVAGISTAIGVKNAGVAAAGSVAEKRENFRNALVLQALPQTQTIYGFIIALLILMGIGVLGAETEISTVQGLAMLGAGVIVALSSISAVFQGMVSSAGIISSAKNPQAFVPSLVFAGQVETPAIFGFITALILLVVGLGVLG